MMSNQQDETSEDISSFNVGLDLDDNNYDVGDDDSASLDSGGWNDPNKTNNGSKPTEKETFTKKETIAVNRSKVMVYIALLLAAAGVGITTYTILSRQQSSVFEIEVCI